MTSPPQGAPLTEDAPRFALVRVEVGSDDQDAAAALLFELGATGLEERDEQTLDRGPGPERVTLVASFADRGAAESAAAALEEQWSPRVEELVGDAWRDAWKQYFAPFRLTDRITVCPPWQSHRASHDDERVLVLEPGRAFGTGLHATTALVARALAARPDAAPPGTGEPPAIVRGGASLAGARVLDVGTGSGILALVAAALGADRVVAIDNDGDAVGVARENIERNGAADRVEASALALADVGGTFDIVTANIEARTLVALAMDLASRVARGGLLILSGILDHQASDVRAAFPELALEASPLEGEWVALLLRRR